MNYKIYEKTFKKEIEDAGGIEKLEKKYLKERIKNMKLGQMTAQMQINIMEERIKNLWVPF